MKPYEEIEFPNGFLRWIREDGKYVCRMTEEEMVEIKALHESPQHHNTDELRTSR